MKFKLIRLLVKIWLGTLFASILCTCGILWLVMQNISESPHQTTWMGILIIWNIFAILFLSIGAVTLFLNYFEKVRRKKLYRFLSFFLVPVLMMAWDITTRISGGQGFSEIAVIFPVLFSFIFCLSIGYMVFSRKLKEYE